MKKISFFIFLLSTIIFLGMLYDESQWILLEYDNIERRGFITSEKVYYMEIDQVARNFSSVEEIIDTAKSQSSEVILAFKYNNGYTGVYYDNYDWHLPLKNGRIFNKEELNSKDTVFITNIDNQSDAIGKSYSKYIFLNAKSVEMEVKDNLSNFSLYSNVKLSKDCFEYDPHIQSDTLLFNKHIIFSLMFILLFVSLSIMYIYSTSKYIMVRKFLGNDILQIVSGVMMGVIINFTFSYLLAIGIYYLLDPHIISYSYTREIFIGILLDKAKVLVIMIMIEATIIYCFARFIPLRKIGWAQEYDV